MVRIPAVRAVRVVRVVSVLSLVRMVTLVRMVRVVRRAKVVQNGFRWVSFFRVTRRYRSDVCYLLTY